VYHDVDHRLVHDLTLATMLAVIAWFSQVSQVHI